MSSVGNTQSQTTTVMHETLTKKQIDTQVEVIGVYYSLPMARDIDTVMNFHQFRPKL